MPGSCLFGLALACLQCPPQVFSRLVAPAGLEVIEESGTTVQLALLDAILNLKHQRPALQLRRSARDGGNNFFSEMLHAACIPAGSR